MRLNLSEIQSNPGGRIPFRFKMNLSDLDFRGYCPIAEPVQVSGEVRNSAGVLLLTAEAETVLHCVCDRCLKEYARASRTELNLVLASELSGEYESDIVLLESDTVDVSDLVTTALILEMDTKSLCSEDCLGLCPRCGKNLNLGNCSCASEPDPRMAVLDKLLTNRQ